MNYDMLESAEFYNRRYHNFSSRIILPTLTLFIFAVIFLAFAKKELSITSTATIEPNKVLYNIQSTSNNVILTNNLKENKVIKAGDVLLKYDSRNEMLQQESYESQLQKIRLQKDQLDLLKASFETGASQFPSPDDYGYYQTFVDYLNQIENLSNNIKQQNSTIASQNAVSSSQKAEIGNAISNLESQISDYQAIRSAIKNGTNIISSNQAYSTYQTYFSQTAELDESEEKQEITNQFIAQIDQQIAQLESNVSSYRIQYAGSGSQQAYVSGLDSQIASLKAQNITKVEQELTTLSNQIMELESTSKLQENVASKTTITASESGVLHLNQDVVGSNVVAEGTILAQVYPEINDESVVKITGYLPSSEIASVTVGDKVRFSTQDDKGETFNLSAKLSSIDSSATRTENGNFFKVEADFKLSKEESKLLKYGLEGRLILITGKKSYLNYYLDKFIGEK